MGETRNTGSSHGKNSLTLQASIESEDRAGDVIRAEGWELDNYRLNPVILWTHRHDLLPVGKSVDVWVENGALMATVEFAPTEFAQQVRRMFEEGFLRGVSVGFRALKTSPRSGNGRRGTVFERQELLEISAAPVPMHPFALAAGRAEAALGRRASSAGHARASAAGLVDLAAGESEQRDLVPLFRELAEIWQSVAGASPSR
ncbi:MAG: HK97 family phage prohead protease [Chloroflexi bacterium]|nr:HK97 family phage prohead protease [Chloroflexota bacterium]